MVTAKAKRVTVLANRVIRASEPIYLRDENNDIRLDSNARPVILKRGDWRAAAWYLERTEPDTYASKDKHEFSGDGLNLNVGLGQEEGKGLFKNIVREIGNEKKYIKRKAKKAKVKLKKS